MLLPSYKEGINERLQDMLGETEIDFCIYNKQNIDKTLLM